ncbi:MAG: hypothetical protein K6E75_13195, partial [Lachnospiraceae bacterium]|nr:hypothetical protein [Lachnospiraceae bacterium]
KSITGRKMVKMIILLITAFAAALTLAVLLLYASSRIPDDRVRENFEKSAEILCEKEVFFCAYQNAACSKIDRYADSILLNIAWNLKSDLPSLMWTSYYKNGYQNENDNLFDAVHKGKDKISSESLKEYVRYWHGPAAIMRILHIFLNIRGIYLLHGILLIMLTLILTVILITRKMHAEAIALIIGMAGVNIWFVPLSLEYYWTFLCMLIASMVVLRFAKKGKKEWFPFLFFMTGIATVYLDFLSTETATLTVPLLLAYRYERKEEKKSGGFRQYAGYSIIWGIGYVGMWVSQWILAACITGENMLPYVRGHVSERMGRNISGLSTFSRLFGTIGKNLACLFPWGYGALGVVSGIAILIIALYIGFVYRSEKKVGGDKMIYAAIAVIPYVRYFVLFNHSFLHYFFTYRAQIVTIMILCLVWFDAVDWGNFKKSRGKRKR